MVELAAQPRNPAAEPAASHPRPRVLLIAEAANPEFSSVPLEGWSHSRAIAGLTDAHIVTQVRNRAAFERSGLVEGRDFTAINSEAVARPVHLLAGCLRGGRGKGWTTVMAMSVCSYLYFERLIWRRFGPSLQRGEYDLVHRLTPLSPTIPSPLARRCQRIGVPFIIGPLNGGLPWPKGFGLARRREREWLSYIRDAYKLVPGYHATRRNAAAIIVGSIATAKQIPNRYTDKCVYIPENAVDPKRFAAKRDDSKAAGQLRVVFLGRLVPYKCPDVLLEAAAPLIREGRLTLTYIGEGPKGDEIRDRIADLGLGKGVRMVGWLNHGEVQHALARHDVLALPSIREFGGAVVLEGMAVGLVPVVVDYGGPGELVTANTGYKIPLGPRNEIIDRMHEVFTRLAERPDELAAKRAVAQERVQRSFTWAAKAKQICEVYRWVRGERDNKPDFGMPLADVSCNAACTPTARLPESEVIAQ